MTSYTGDEYVSFLSKTELPCYLYHVCIIYKKVQQNIYPFALNLNLSDIWYHDRWSVIIPQKFTKRKPIHAKNIVCNSWSTTGTFCVLLQPPMEPVNMTGTCYNDLRVWYDLVSFKFESQFYENAHLVLCNKTQQNLDFSLWTTIQQ